MRPGSARHAIAGRAGIDGVIRLLACLCAALCSLGARAASAHQSSLSYANVRVAGDGVDYDLRLSSKDLYEALGIHEDRPVTRSEAESQRARLVEYVTERIHVRAATADCRPTLERTSYEDVSDGFFVALGLHYACPGAAANTASLSIRYDLFFDLDPRHQGLVRLEGAGRRGGAPEAASADSEGSDFVFRDGARTLELSAHRSPWAYARDYLVLGVEHIFTGYDHVAFLFGLLVVVGGLGLRAGARRALGVVSAFTLSHSITLFAAALGALQLSPRLVEPAIALSIVYVAVENLVDPAPRHRFGLAFVFGLVHGFGFASVLREIGLPARGLVLSLASFNVGVELGQLAIVAAVLPLLGRIAPSASTPDVTSSSRRWGQDLLAVAVVPSLAFLVLRRFAVAVIPVSIVAFGAAPLLFVAGRRLGYERAVRLGGSTLLLLLGLLWFAERVLDRSLLGGMLG